jgi:LysM repeat protein
MLEQSGGGYGTEILSGYDDEYQEVDITSVFPYGLKFGTNTFDSIYISTNGYIGFDPSYESEFSSYEPEGIPGYEYGPIVAGQFDDIDLGEGGQLFYFLDDASGLVVITYENVAAYDSDSYYANEPNTGNTFQIVLRRASGYSSTNNEYAIELRYNKIDWHTSGNVIDDGFPTSGWSNGNLTEYGETTYSGMSNFQNNLNASNIGQSGIFRWGVYDGNVEEEEEELPVKKTTSNHELVTLLTNPMDTSGVRTMDLNYYMNDPIIWGSDVKNITVWLETEIFDLAVAKQKAKLPVGLMLLKDYNIRLMMKIVYNDGTVETKEVDNAHIARNIPVLIPVDEFAGTSDLGIVYMDTEGNTAVLPVTPVIIDGMNYLKFENNHFSEYGVVSGTAMTPAEQQQYIIQPGDTLASIAANFGVTVQSLAAANNISNLDMIYAGKVLIIA